MDGNSSHGWFPDSRNVELRFGVQASRRSFSRRPVLLDPEFIPPLQKTFDSEPNPTSLHLRGRILFTRLRILSEYANQGCSVYLSGSNTNYLELLGSCATYLNHHMSLLLTSFTYFYGPLCQCDRLVSRSCRHLVFRPSECLPAISRERDLCSMAASELHF